jgi:hypothetical protein
MNWSTKYGNLTRKEEMTNLKQDGTATVTCKRKKRTSKTPQIIGFVGDTHVGSHWGLYPESKLPGHPGSWLGVRYLNQCFSHMVNAFPDLDLLVLQGDLIDGHQSKSESTGVFSSKLGDQVEAAIEVLEPLAKKAKTIIRVDGTPYHEGFNNALLALDYALGVKKTEQVFDIELLPGSILNCAHHPTGGSALYYGTKVDRDSLLAKVAASDCKVPLPRWIVRSHLHTMILQVTEHVTTVQLPCFQLITAYAKKSNYWRWQPTIGGMIMRADQEDPSGYKFIPHLYAVPLPRVLSGGDL